MIKKISKEKKRLIIGATGASGIPVLQKCLELIKEEEEDYESWLVLTKSGELTCQQESKLSVEEIEKTGRLLPGTRRNWCKTCKWFF